MAPDNFLPIFSPALERHGVCKEFTFPGDSESMVASRQAIMDFIKPHSFSELDEIDILVALQEALANAVFHGCKDDPSKAIYCAVEIDPAGVTIIIRDPGPGFDVEAVTQPTEAGANTSEHGRGICLMRSLMDEVTYQRGGAEVQLRKLRAASPSVA